MRACINCGGPIAFDNAYGYCAHTPACRSLYQAAWQVAHGGPPMPPCKSCGIPTASKYGYCKRTPECQRLRDAAHHRATYQPVRSCAICEGRLTKVRLELGAGICHRCDGSDRRSFDRVVKMAAFMAYGNGTCACCGEDRLEFLSLDHINGDGAAHRREIGGSNQGSRLYRYLRKRGWPEKDRLAVLCHSCNQAKGVLARCPCDGGRAPKLKPEILGQLPLF